MTLVRPAAEFDDEITARSQSSVLKTSLKSNREIERLEEEGYNPAVIESLTALNERRANKGQNAYTLGSALTDKAVYAAQMNQSVTEPKNRSPWDIFGNTTDNMSLIGSVMSPTVLARGLMREVGGLSSIPQSISESLNEAGSLKEAVGNLAGKPGFDLIPGSYTAEHLLGSANGGEFGMGGGGWKELARNPVLTGLDLLPYPGVAARASKPGKALMGARKSAFEQASALNKQAMDIDPLNTLPVKAYRRPGALALARERVVDGTITPTPFGKKVSAAGGKLRESKPGQWVNKASQFGQAGDMSQIVSQNADAVKHARTHVPEFEGIEQMLKDLQVDTKNLKVPEEIQKEILHRLEREGVTADFSKLGDDANTFAERVKYHASRIEQEFHGNKNLEEGVQLGYITLAGKKVSAPLQDIADFHKRALIRGMAQKVANTQSLDGALDVAAHLDELDDLLTSEFRYDGAKQTKGSRKEIAEIYLNRLERAGYDTQAWWKSASEGDFSWVKEADSLQQTAAMDNLIANSVDLLHRRGKPPVPWGDYKVAIREKNWSSARRALVKMKTDHPFSADHMDALKEGLKRKAKVAERVERDHRKMAKRVIEGTTRKDARYVPPAWNAVLSDFTKKGARRRVMEQTADAAAIDKQFDLIEAGMYKSVAEDVDLGGLRREAQETMREYMETATDNPVFVHNIGRDQLREIYDPTIVANPDKMARSAKNRSLEYNEPVGLPMLQMQHGLQDIMQAKLSRNLGEQMPELFGVHHTKLTDELMPKALAIQRVQKSRNLGEILDELKSKHWSGYDAGMFGGKKLSGMSGPEFYIPKAVAGVLDDMVSGGPLSGLENILEPITQIFRTSVLPLALRWHINNVGGNGLMYAFRSHQPWNMIQYYSDAHRMLKTGDFGDIPAEQLGIGSGVGSMSASSTIDDAAKLAMRSANVTDQAKWIYQFKAARTARRLWDSVQDNLIDPSFKFNQHVDSATRITGYFDAYEHAVKQGFTHSAAKEMGVNASKKMMQQWSRMTPIERSLIRSIFPFYGFMSHVMRYVLTYPADHPWRASILANFANAELEDYGTGLPMKFFEMFNIGGMGGDGKQLAIDPGGVNPFSDLGDYFKIQGFVGQMNPVFSTMLETWGVDTMSGSSELYPGTEYDRETGRMTSKEATVPDFFSSLIGNTVPQAEGFSQLLGISEGFWTLLEDDPDAARRMIQSPFGFPSAFRYIDVPKERFNAELAKGEDQRAAFNRAAKDGNPNNLSSVYPSIGAAYLDQYNALTPEQQEDLRVETPETPLDKLKARLP